MTTASHPASVDADWEQPLTPVPDPDAVVPAPEPAADAEPEPAEPEWEAESDWDGERVDFHGDQIAYKVPTQSAFAALGIGAGPGATQYDQAFYARYFLSEHLSPASFRRFMMRSIRPDGYPADVEDPQGDLIDVISKPLIQELEAKAEAAKSKAKGKK